MTENLTLSVVKDVASLNYWDNFLQYISSSDEYLTVENDILKNHLKFKDF